MNNANTIKDRIKVLMGTGIESIKPCSYFTTTLHISRRHFRQELAELRKELPIVSRDTEPCGYYIAEDIESVEEFIHDLQSTIKGYQNLIDLMQEHKERMDETR